MNVVHLPFVYNFESKTKLNYFVMGNVGYSKVSLSGSVEELPGGAVLNYLNIIQTYTGGFGGGVGYALSKNILISTGLEVIYSRSGASVIKPDNGVGDVIEDFFNKNYSDNISYKFFTSLEYRTTIKKFKPYVSLEYNIYETKSSFSFSDLTSFDSESSIVSINVGVETPRLLSYDKDNYLTLEAYVQGHKLFGVVKDVAKVDNYGSLGGVAYWNTSAEPWWASRFFFEANGVKGDGIYGYNVGLGFTLDF
ncbi:MAG TPA: hypothetical protein EYO75_05785 [Sulfurimonas sp.]|nr:hypothetical protein [Sulfurimonas sp.]HIM75326.1 hypothetical protein [Campylobacterales bacterium]